MTQVNQCIGAVDIGGSKIAVGAVSANGIVLSKRSFATAKAGGWEGGVPTIAAALEECRREAGMQLKMVGIGCTGPVDPRSGVIGRVALLPGWEGCHLTGALRHLTAVEVSLENDADAAALAEFYWGSGRGTQRFLYVTVSTGIGTGFVCNRVLYRGAAGSHPEMGHHTIDPLGPPCYCGCRGCWESLASGTAIERRFNEYGLHAGLPTLVKNAQSIFELARDGDAIATRTIEGFLQDLSTGLANVTSVLVPDVIALGGGVMQSMQPYLKTLQKLVKARCGEVASGNSVIRPAELDQDVGLAGAAAVAISRLKRDRGSGAAAELEAVI